MSEVKKIGEGNGYVNATVGNPCEFEGKVFTKDILGTTSCDISFGSLAPGQAVPFYHDHKENEEVYIEILLLLVGQVKLPEVGQRLNAA